MHPSLCVVAVLVHPSLARFFLSSSSHNETYHIDTIAQLALLLHVNHIYRLSGIAYYETVKADIITHAKITKNIFPKIFL